MTTDIEEKVLEKLATSDKATIVVERQSDGKMRVTSGSWDGEKVILKDQVLEVRNVEGRPPYRASRGTTTRATRRLHIEPYGSGVSDDGLSRRNRFTLR
jgi:hypothetical protein